MNKRPMTTMWTLLLLLAYPLSGSCENLSLVRYANVPRILQVDTPAPTKKKPVKAPTRKPVQKPVKKPVQKPVKKPVKKPHKKPTKKPSPPDNLTTWQCAKRVSQVLVPMALS